MKENKVRKEIQLTQEVIDALQIQADKEDRLLKNYMEQVLIKQSKKENK